MARSTSGESVLERAVRILDVLNGESTSTSITDIAAKAGLPLSTASRLIDELICHGLLARDIERRVQIGVRLHQMGVQASATGRLRDAARPSMADLQVAVGHHVLLGVVENDEVTFVERMHPWRSELLDVRVATRIPVHASACGLAILAHAPSAVQDRVLHATFPRYTDTTITDARQLREALARVRKFGFALCPGFLNPKVTAVSVPIFGPGGTAVAALSVLLPRTDPASCSIPALTSAAQQVTAALVASRQDKSTDTDAA